MVDEIDEISNKKEKRDYNFIHFRIVSR